MPIDDLSALAGVDERHRAVLGEKLGVMSCYELILADRQRIVEAFGRKSFKPTLEDVAAWQDEARRKRMAAAAATDWEEVASFAVVFEQRPRGEGTEHRVLVEQTEVEPEASPQEWPSWDCGNICGWMLDRLGLPAASSPDAAHPAASGAVERVSTSTAPPRPSVSIKRATLSDASGEVELVADGSVCADLRPDWVPPGRLMVALVHPAQGAGVEVALQLGRADNAPVGASGHIEAGKRSTELDLSGLDEGAYRATLAAWTVDGSCRPAFLKLPTVFINPVMATT